MFHITHEMYSKKWFGKMLQVVSCSYYPILKSLWDDPHFWENFCGHQRNVRDYTVEIIIIHIKVSLPNVDLLFILTKRMINCFDHLFTLKVSSQHISYSFMKLQIIIISHCLVVFISSSTASLVHIALTICSFFISYVTTWCNLWSGFLLKP